MARSCPNTRLTLLILIARSIPSPIRLYQIWLLRYLWKRSPGGWNRGNPIPPKNWRRKRPCWRRPCFGKLAPGHDLCFACPPGQCCGFLDQLSSTFFADRIEGHQPAGSMPSNHCTALALMYLASLANLVEVCSGMLDLDGNHFAERGLMALIFHRKLPHDEMIPAVVYVEQQLGNMSLHRSDKSQRSLNRSMLVIQHLNPFFLVVGSPYKDAPRVSQDGFDGHQGQRGAQSKMMDDLANRPLIGGTLQVEIGFAEAIKRCCNIVAEFRVGSYHRFG